MEPDLPLSTSSRNAFSTFLTVVGSVLIILGILFMIYASWDSFSPLARAILAWLPVLFLYGVAITSRNKPELKHIASYTWSAAYIGVPLSIGTLLYQLDIYNHADSKLTTYSLLLALIPIIGGYVALKDSLHTFFLVFYSLCVLMIFGPAWHLDFRAISFAIPALGLGYLLFAALLSPKPLTTNRRIFNYFGLALVTIGLFAIPLSFAPQSHFCSSPQMYSYGYNDTVGYGSSCTDPAIPLVEIAVFSASALSFLLLAILYSLSARLHREYDLFQARAFLENVPPYLLILPVANTAVNSHDFLFTALLLLASIICISLSFLIRVISFRYLGMLGLLIATYPLFLTLMRSLEALWPVALVLSGVLLILLALLASRKELRLNSQWLNRQPIQGFLGLGDRYQEVSRPNDSAIAAGAGYTIQFISLSLLISAIIFATVY